MASGWSHRHSGADDGVDIAGVLPDEGAIEKAHGEGARAVVRTGILLCNQHNCDLHANVLRAWGL